MSGVRLPAAPARWSEDYQRLLNAELERQLARLNPLALVPSGGTAGQALVKASDRPLDLEWGAGGGGGVTDHGALTGLSDNDHPQYSLTTHAHTITNTRGAAWTRPSGVILLPANDVVVRVPRACTVTGWHVFGRGVNNTNVLGSCQIDIWRAASGAYPPSVANTITGTDKPRTSSASSASSTSLTGWTTALNAGDTLLFRLESASLFSQIFVYLTTQEST